MVRVIAHRSARVFLRAALCLLVLSAAARAQVSLTPAAGSITFADTTLNATSLDVTSQFTLATADTVHFSVPNSMGGSPEFLIDSVTGCTADGITVNPAATVCSVAIKFFPAYPGIRNVPLTATTSTHGTFQFGLTGFGIEPLLGYIPTTISTIAGTPASGNAGDGGLATAATFNNPNDVKVDYAGNIYILSVDNGGLTTVRRVDALTGKISTVYLSTDSEVTTWPHMALDAAGNLYVSSPYQSTVSRRDAVTGAVTIYAGGGTGGDGSLATSAQLDQPTGLAVDTVGNLYIADMDKSCVRAVNAVTKIISTVVGPCSDAHTAYPFILAMDHANNLYIADYLHQWVSKFTIGSSSAPIVIAGGGIASPGDGGAATSAVLAAPYGLAVDAAGDLYISERDQHVVRKVDASTQIISTVVGIFNAPTTPFDSSATIGDGGAATSAHLDHPVGIDLDGAGNLYIADMSHYRIRKVAMTSTSGVTTLLVSPTYMDMGTVAVGSAGNAWTVTVNNTTGTAVRIASISLSDAIDFTQTNNCVTILPAHSTCNVQISFTPQSNGALSTTLNVVDSANGSPQTAFAIGTGDLNASLPAAFLSPTPIDFGTVTTGTSQSPWTFTLNNTSGVPLTITDFELNGTGFTMTQNCGVLLAPHTTCTGTVAFTAGSAGTYNGFIQVTDNAPDSPQIITLSGIATGTAIQLAPSSLDFGNETVGFTSNTQTVTVNNVGDTAVTLSGPIGVTGPYAQTNNCGTTLAAHSTCTVLVTFTPTATGTQTGALSVPADTVPPAPVNLTGVGTTSVPVVFFSPATIDFGNQPVGITSNAWTVTLNNTSDTLATFSVPVTISGSGFGLTSSCGTTLAPHTTCNLQVTFDPSTTGIQTGQLSAQITGSASPITVSLTGNGTSNAPNVIFAPQSIDFGNQPVGTPGNPWTVTLNNTSDFAATYSALHVTGSTDFTETDNCGTSLAAHTTCNIQVIFTPSATTTSSGALYLLLTTPGSVPQTVPLTGVGTSSTPTITLAPTSINFGDQAVGTTSNAWTMTVNNPSGTAVNFSAPIAISGNPSFVQTNSCGLTLAANSTCNILITFAPISPGTQTGQVVVLVNGNATPFTAALTGNGTDPSTAVFFSPSTIDFQTQAVGTSSNAWTVTLNNTSGTNLTFAAPISVTGSGAFTQTNNCGVTLAAHTTCNVLVTFSPFTTGTLTGQLTAFFSGIPTPITAALTGTGTDTSTAVFFSPVTTTFSAQPVGTSSNTQTVTLNNTSGTDLTFSSPILLFGQSFTQTNNCGTTLAAHTTCNVLVTFTPTSTGTQTGQLVTSFNGSSAQITASLTGTGTDLSTAVFFSPTTYNFGTQIIATTSNAVTVTLNNTTGSPVAVSAPTLASDGSYAQTNNCGATLAAHTTCNFQLTFTPDTAGTIPGTLIVVLNGATAITVQLTGVGQEPPPAVLQFTPSNIDFAGQLVGTTNTIPVTLTNTGSTTAPFAGPIAVVGSSAFTQTNNCGLSLAGHASCTVLITFLPSTAGTVTGQVQVLVTGASVLDTVTVSGTGLAIASSIFFSPTPIDFGKQLIGTSNTWSMTLNNTSSQAVTFSGVGLTNSTDFSQTNTCTTTLPAHSTCNIQVTFAPTSAGTITGSVTGTINGVLETVPLTGNGAIPPDYTLTVSPNVMTLQAGQTGIATFTFAPVGGYVGTVSFACNGLPQGTTCTFAPPSVTANGSDTIQTAQLTVTTTGPFTGVISENRMGGSTVVLATVLLPGVLFCGLVALRRRKLGLMKTLLLAVVTLLLASGATGCAGFSHFTPAGQTKVSVTASAGAVSGGSTTGDSTTHTANFTLIIHD